MEPDGLQQVGLGLALLVAFVRTVEAVQRGTEAREARLLALLELALQKQQQKETRDEV